MGRNGDGEGTVSAPECCMCGDYGVSSELFRCKDCRFRSQHKYCSNQYPEAQSYDTCNWCHSEKNERKGEVDAKTSPTSSSISQDSNQNENHEIKMMNKSKRVLGHHKGLSNIKITSSKKIIKSRNTTPTAYRSTPSAGEKRIIAVGHGGINNSNRIIRRTRSEEMSNGGTTVIKQVFRNRIRRYKLLDEVSS